MRNDNAVTEKYDRITQILHFCPHNHTLAHVTLSEVDGKRAIIKWVFEAPVDQEHAVSMAQQLGDSEGAQMKVLHTGPLQ